MGLRLNIYLDHLKQSMEKVDLKYYSTHAHSYSGLQVDVLYATEERKYRQQVERVYCYELYHQFRCTMLKNSKNYQDLVLNGEITKIDLNKTTRGKRSIIPDFVLHKCQTNKEINYQTLFIEVKASIKPEISNDLKKIMFAVNNLGFQYGVLIVINSDFNFIESAIKKFVENYGNISEKSKSNIYLFHSLSPQKIEIKTLYEIISP